MPLCVIFQDTGHFRKQCQWCAIKRTAGNTAAKIFEKLSEEGEINALFTCTSSLFCVAGN